MLQVKRREELEQAENRKFCTTLCELEFNFMASLSPQAPVPGGFTVLGVCVSTITCCSPKVPEWLQINSCLQAPPPPTHALSRHPSHVRAARPASEHSQWCLSLPASVEAQPCTCHLTTALPPPVDYWYHPPLIIRYRKGLQP